MSPWLYLSLFYCLFLNISISASSSLLPGVFNLSRGQPVIFLVDSDVGNLREDSLRSDGSSDDSDSSSVRADSKTQPREGLDSAGIEDLEVTKEILRLALRARCQKLDKCVKKCPEVKPSCENKCQKVYDEEDACGKKPKRGRTMPPDWWLRQLLLK